MINQFQLPNILRTSPTLAVFGAGRLSELGSLAAAERASRVLLVCDAGLTAAGHTARTIRSLRDANLDVTVFDAVEENPTTVHVEAGLRTATAAVVDFIVALGGGSVMDCAKGINLLLTNGGRIHDYWGINKPTKPMLPLIAIPTTAGTGSEAQSFALISDPITHQKMACGDRRLPTEGGLRPRVAILDPELTRTQPPRVAAATGLDAIAHAVETAGCNARTESSIEFSREAWRLLSRAFETAIADPANDAARADMLLGAHLAGCAIEQSMLGAAHACANPLTARFGIVHGVAVSIMLPHVIRFNAEIAANPYAPIAADPLLLAGQVEKFIQVAHTPTTLRACDVPLSSLLILAEEAAKQWTAGFNPRPVGTSEMLQLYQAAWC